MNLWPKQLTFPLSCLIQQTCVRSSLSLTHHITHTLTHCPFFIIQNHFSTFLSVLTDPSLFQSRTQSYSYSFILKYFIFQKSEPLFAIVLFTLKRTTFTSIWLFFFWPFNNHIYSIFYILYYFYNFLNMNRIWVSSVDIFYILKI